jgi:hypothetical protein
MSMLRTIDVEVDNEVADNDERRQADADKRLELDIPAIMHRIVEECSSLATAREQSTRSTRTLSNDDVDRGYDDEPAPVRTMPNKDSPECPDEQLRPSAMPAGPSWIMQPAEEIILLGICRIPQADGSVRHEFRPKLTEKQIAPDPRCPHTCHDCPWEFTLQVSTDATYMRQQKKSRSEAFAADNGTGSGIPFRELPLNAILVLNPCFTAHSQLSGTTPVCILAPEPNSEEKQRANFPSAE